MSRTRTFTEFSAEGILAAMRPDRDYRAGFIAQSLGVSSKEVRRLLDQMVESGQLRMRFDEHAREHRFLLRAAQSPQVAQARDIGRRLTEVLSNYENEMRERAALCMTVRREY
ncbi:hypothetical protein FAZ69_32135 [Trinickia terrae]|uniref:MarR family transcriptional regulator n=1 Tax=Trinickia terrae TaxID=2571161 RepID=A0A4U1HFV8_9BURK|nr:hypothetical protein [Trinickia terrae]TKC78074.1 hypothetical protein FAZ69_32135 [Trinickia terrae]